MSSLRSLRKLWVTRGILSQFSSVRHTIHSAQSSAYSASKRNDPKQAKFRQAQRKRSYRFNQNKLQERHSWLSKMHASLMKDADLPPPPQDNAFNEGQLQSCSTESLLSMVWNVTQIDKFSTSLMIELWRRMNSMDFEQILSVADILFINDVQAKWYLGSITAYFLEVVDVVELTPSQLTRLVFHTLDRHRATPLNFHLALEEVILRSIDSLSVNQTAEICRSFFTSQIHIRSIDLLDKMSLKLLQEFDSLSPHYFPLFMKTMRYSNFIKVSFYKDLGDLLVERNYMENFLTLAQIMHIAYGYASVRVSHPVLFSSMLQACSHPKYKRRLKDLAQLIWSCGTLVTDNPPDISAIKKIITYLEHNLSLKETLDHPGNLVDLVNGLCFLNLHSDFLLNSLFHPRSVSGIIERAKLDESKLPQLSVIDSSLDIDYPGYTGNRLKEESKKQIASLLGEFSIEEEMSLRKGFREAVLALQQVLGEERVLCTRLLPHLHTADICVVLDSSECKFVSYQDVTDQTSDEKETHFVKLAIQILSRMQTSYDGKPLGMLHLKLRQLKSLEFHPVLIDADDAHRFVYSDTQIIQETLLKKISQVVRTDLGFKVSRFI